MHTVRRVRMIMKDNCTYPYTSLYDFSLIPSSGSDCNVNHTHLRIYQGAVGIVLLMSLILKVTVSLITNKIKRRLMAHIFADFFFFWFCVLESTGFQPGIRVVGKDIFTTGFFYVGNLAFKR